MSKRKQHSPEFKAKVVRLKADDGGVFGRLDEEVEAVSKVGISFSVVPGITSAAAAAAAIGTSLTRRGRNSGLSLFTAHEADGFSEQDWTRLARPGAVAAVYMGKAASSILRDRLLAHGADPAVPVTIVANASRPDQQILEGRLETLHQRAAEAHGTAVILIGLAPHAARSRAGASLLGAA